MNKGAEKLRSRTSGMPVRKVVDRFQLNASHTAVWRWMTGRSRPSWTHRMIMEDLLGIPHSDWDRE